MNRPPTDLRRYRRRTEIALTLAVVLIFIVGGGAAVGLVYGWPAVLTALLCLVPGALSFALLWLALLGLEHLTRHWH